MEIFDSYVLFALIALPLVGAVVIMGIPGYRPDTIKWTASAFGLVAILLSFYAFFGYDYDAGGLQFTRTWQWLEIPGPWQFGERGISLTLGLDGIGAPMVLLTGIVMFTGVLIVPEPQNTDSLRFHPVGSYGVVVLLLGVLTAVYFNCQLLFEAEKVDYVSPQRVLLTESVSVEFTTAQVLPEG